MSVFSSVHILPSRGLQSSMVTWTLMSPLQAGTVYVYYSDTGVKGSWTLKTPTGVGGGVGFWEDDSFVVHAGHIVGYYRLMVEYLGERHDSEIVGIFSTLTKKEYGMIHKIMHREYQSMRATNGYPVYHCIPKHEGTAASNVDPDTGEIVGLQCEVTDPAEQGYGTAYAGGFYPPILTWMRSLGVKRDTLKDALEDMGTDETDSLTVRLLAYPKPLRGHMLVDPKTDRRYLVNDEVQGFYLRGIYPIAYEAELQLLSVADPRHKLPMPEFDVDLLRRLPSRP